MPKIATKENCTGCTACVSACPKGCIRMIEDENGFFHPVIDADQCVACGLCEKTCPIVHPLKKADNEPKAYAASSKNEAMRLNSSSGGVFTEVAKVVLEHGGAVFGAAYNEKFEVVHTCAEDEEGLAKFRGAKYAQSDLHGIFAQVKMRLDRGQQILFSGTPCQVGGLKAFLCKDYENLLTMDFVCHSVPSPLAWREYVKYRAEQDRKGEMPIAINLRSKHTGWSRYQYSNLFQYEDGFYHSAKSNESIYMKLFVNGCINRDSCANCRFKGYNRVSDLTIGDFWGIWDIMPEMDDNKGTSVVLVQSERGKAILESLKDRIQMMLVSLEEASRQNPAILKSFSAHEKRGEAFSLIKEGKIDECEKWFAESRTSFFNRATKFVNFLRHKIVRD